MQTLNRILIILTITILVGLVMVPLAQTNWANDMRTTTSDQSQEGRLEGAGAQSSSVSFFAGLLRPAIVLLFLGSITLGISNLIRRFNKKTPANIKVTPSNR